MSDYFPGRQDNFKDYTESIALEEIKVSDCVKDMSELLVNEGKIVDWKNLGFVWLTNGENAK